MFNKSYMYVYKSCFDKGQVFKVFECIGPVDASFDSPTEKECPVLYIGI